MIAFTGQLAVEKLVEFKCKKPIFVGYHSSFPGEVDKRFEGFQAACKKFHIDPVFLYEPDTKDSYETLFQFFKSLENEQEHSLDFDGIFANTDYHACGAVRILNDLGYSVPQDVQIIGFDGTKKFYPSDEYVVSTICQPLPELAKQCVDMILNAENGSLPTLTLLPVTYEYGGTTIR